MLSLLKRRTVATISLPAPEQKQLPSLALCIALDLVGYASFAVPFFGEFIDLIWAPLSAVAYWKLFGFKRGFFGGWFSFIEELLPGLDFIPTFTLTWLLLHRKKNRQVSIVASH